MSASFLGMGGKHVVGDMRLQQIIGRGLLRACLQISARGLSTGAAVGDIDSERMLLRVERGTGGEVRVLSRLFWRLFLTALAGAHATGRLRFFGEIKGLCRREAFAAHLAAVRRKNWFLCAKPPFAGQKRCSPILPATPIARRHGEQPPRGARRARRNLPVQGYRRNRQARYRTMTLADNEFIRRFLLRVLPEGFHRVRHYGLLASPAARPTSHAQES